MASSTSSSFSSLFGSSSSASTSNNSSSTDTSSPSTNTSSPTDTSSPSTNTASPTDTASPSTNTISLPTSTSAAPPKSTTGKSVTSAATALAMFFLMTLTYFIAKYYLVDRHMDQRGSTSTILVLIYLVFVIGTQLFSNISTTSILCNGTPQVTTALAYTLLPNILIFGSLIVLLKVFPGWRAPFSNTLGFALVYFMGVNDALTDLLATKGSKLIQKICDDKAILINEMTHLNYKVYLETMAKDGLLVKNYQSLPAYKSLWEMVGVKNAAADFVWYILTGALVISTTYNSILDITCSYSKQQKSSAAANYHTQQAAAKKNKKETKYFTIHD